MSSISLDAEAGQGHALHIPLLVEGELPVVYLEVLGSTLPSSKHGNKGNDYQNYTNAEDNEEKGLAL
jgi:hypothetical protein